MKWKTHLYVTNSTLASSQHFGVSQNWDTDLSTFQKPAYDVYLHKHITGILQKHHHNLHTSVRSLFSILTVPFTSVTV